MKKTLLATLIAAAMTPAAMAETHHHGHAIKVEHAKAPLINLEEEAKKYAGVDTHAAADHAKKSDHADDKKHAAHKAHWGYSGETGPDHWGDLDPKYIMCKLGVNQSPIDIRDKVAVGTVGLPGLTVAYGQPQLRVINNGHTIQVNYPIGNSHITVGNHRFELLQFHFHTPSEHTKEGFNYPMEMHLVHKDGDGNLAVIGILYKEGEHNAELQKLIDHLPKDVGKEHHYKGVHIDLTKFFPAQKLFYKYSGSLTTPPCSEGVYWMVFKQPIEASADQIDAMHALLHTNNRPVQGVHSRHVLKSWAEPDMSNDFYYY
ncbi:carbonic anhydrase [Sulfurivirga caldicuralii]|uniref:carbonic anhydrase n=1 Tax=Sulfurivirga caldicuralii TaxID=364032 RepID=A0A1N6EUJ4_9GAMM|nr:carbonic anhydrase family protein [Sulfurivirga caldicuralii]SIN86686.1 carbonic anhydrase [Sulfurivirga caldicuralii]